MDGAQAGIALPAHPEPGMDYRQEYYKGEAEDKAAVITVGQDRSRSRSGTSTKAVLMTRDLVPTEPKVQELKFYAPGVGPLLSVHTDGDRRPSGAGQLRARRLAERRLIAREPRSFGIGPADPAGRSHETVIHACITLSPRSEARDASTEPGCDGQDRREIQMRARSQGTPAIPALAVLAQRSRSAACGSDDEGDGDSARRVRPAARAASTSSSTRPSSPPTSTIPTGRWRSAASGSTGRPTRRASRRWW